MNLSNKAPRALLQAVLLGVASLAVSVSSLAAGGGGGTATKPTVSTKDYDVYLTGNAGDVAPTRPASPMLVLMGGGLDVDNAFKRMIDRASGVEGDCLASGSTAPKVDVVIVRTSGSDGYNPYLMNQIGRGCKVDSVESIVIKSRVGADSAAVVDRVAKAEVVFIAGGDQATYLALWKGTRLEAALRALPGRNAPFGGTSAGLAVLGDVDYTGAAGSITSLQALADPYHKAMTLDATFLNGLPGLSGVVTDSHLVTRERMGRLVTFLARMSVDVGPKSPTAARGIGVDEATAVVLTGASGSQAVEVIGTGVAYFLQPTIAPTTLVARKPLTFRSVAVRRVPAGTAAMSLAEAWTSASYHLAAESGVLTSSQSGGSPF